MPRGLAGNRKNGRGKWTRDVIGVPSLICGVVDDVLLTRCFAHLGSCPGAGSQFCCSRVGCPPLAPSLRALDLRVVFGSGHPVKSQDI